MLNTLLIGCGGMGRIQAKLLASLPEYRLVAVVDAIEANATAVAEAQGCAWGLDVASALATHRPEVVAICTGNDTHAALTIQCAAAGVKAIHCEKPMAVHLADARAMVAACRASGTRLIINHQRRTGADLLALRHAITSGAIGQVRRIRMQCAGDVLSDGTHLVDSLRFLVGDLTPEWVLSAMHRGDPALKPPPKAQSNRAGWRFNHPVEDGAVAQIQFPGGIRAEILCGDQVEGYCAYQHYEVFGTNGRLWRWGDGKPCAASGKTGPATWDPHIFISDGKPGTHQAVFDPASWPYRPKPHAGGEWRVLEPQGDPLADLIAGSYRRLAVVLAEGGEHPMDMAVGLADMELTTAIYASAQRGTKIVDLATLPERFPLYEMCPDAR